MRNVAGTVKAFAFNATNNQPVTGDVANITGQLSKDGGAFAPLAGAKSELGGGFYLFQTTAAERDATTCDYIFASTTPNVIVNSAEQTRYTRNELRPNKQYRFTNNEPFRIRRRNHFGVISHGGRI